jgi:cholesterol oxidase
VADGSVVPSSIGFHPVLTISARADRPAEAAVTSL